MAALAGLISAYLVIYLNLSKYFLMGLLQVLGPSYLMLVYNTEGVFTSFFHLLAVNFVGDRSKNFVMLDSERLLFAVEIVMVLCFVLPVFAEVLVARKIFVRGMWLAWGSSKSFSTFIFFQVFSRTDIWLVIILLFSLPTYPCNYWAPSGWTCGVSWPHRGRGWLCMGRCRVVCFEWPYGTASNT